MFRAHTGMLSKEWYVVVFPLIPTTIGIIIEAQ